MPARRAREVAAPFAFVGRMFVIGRGPEFATAREIALKLLETCRVAAEPLTATDLAHGPVAALDPLFPVWAIAPDANLPAVLDAVARAREAGATSSRPAPRRRDRGRRLRAAPPAPRRRCSRRSSRWCPGQLFACGARPREGPRSRSPAGLAKVTLAR